VQQCADTAILYVPCNVCDNVQQCADTAILSR